MIKVKSLDEMPESIGGATIDERETTIRKDCQDKKAHICTMDVVEYRKLMRKCRANPEAYKAIGYDICEGQVQVAYFECPTKLVRYGTPMSEAHRAAAAENAKKMADRRFASKGAAPSPEAEEDDGEED